MTRISDNGWLRSKGDDQNFQKLLAREDFIEDFLHEIDRIMIEQNVSRAELARRMKCRPSNVTQLFRRTRNLTAASMVDISFHLGLELRLMINRRTIRLNRAQSRAWVSVATLQSDTERVAQPLVHITFVGCAAGTEQTDYSISEQALAL